MRYARTTAACLAAAAALLALTGCGGAGYKKTGVTASLPDMTRMTLTDAETAADAAGFTHLSSTDATGSHRSPDGGTWTVCTQKPGSGSADTGVPVKLSVVRSGETCPVGHSGSSYHSPTSHYYSHRPTYRSTHRSSSGGYGGSSSHSYSHSRSRSHH